MKKYELSFDAIGTHWTLQAQSGMAASSWRQLVAAVHARIETFDKAYSRFRNDSLVADMAQKPGRFTLPSDAYPLLDFYERLYQATDGSVTPFIGQTVSDAGYDANYSLKSKVLHQPPRWEDVMGYTKTHITLSQPALLDFGAAGKGYLVDIISDLLSDADVANYFINAGGDILHRTSGGDALQVGLENPLDASEVVGVATLHNQSLCASSGSRRTWGEYTHIIDPHSLKSPQDIIATWAVAADTMTADGLATALFFTNPAALQKTFSFSYALLRSNMSLEYSKDFPVQIYEVAK